MVGPISEHASPPAILIVDDDPRVARSLARMARELGFEADAVFSAQEAIRLAESVEFQVIATDLMMPDVNGVQLIQVLAERCPNTVFLLVTGVEDLTGFPLAPTERIVSVITKPVRWGEAQEALTRALEFNVARKARSLVPGIASRTLLVEDSPTDALLIGHTLEMVDGKRPDVARRLSEALEKLHQVEYDTIVTDLSLPDGRGLDAVVRLRSAAPNATLLVCSGTDDEVMVLQVVDRGAQDFVSKQSMTTAGLRRTLGIARTRRTAELRLARLAFYDGLTGLANRTSLHDGLVKMIALARRDRLKLGLLFIDLNGFKAINDEHGHDAGDAVLKTVAERLREQVREYDIVARLGGDEFVLAVSHVDKLNLEPLAERILASLQKPIPHRGKVFEISASVGLALFPDAGTEPSALLRLADQAMYVAKRDPERNVHWAASIPPGPDSASASSRPEELRIEPAAIDARGLLRER